MFGCGCNFRGPQFPNSYSRKVASEKVSGDSAVVKENVSSKVLGGKHFANVYLVRRVKVQRNPASVQIARVRMQDELIKGNAPPL